MPVTIISDDGVTRVQEITDANGKILGHNFIDITPQAVVAGTIGNRLDLLVTAMQTVWNTRPNPALGPGQQTAMPTPAQIWTTIRAVQAMTRIVANRFDDGT